MAFYVLMCC